MQKVNQTFSKNDDGHGWYTQFLGNFPNKGKGSHADYVGLNTCLYDKLSKDDKFNKNGNQMYKTNKGNSNGNNKKKSGNDAKKTTYFFSTMSKISNNNTKKNNNISKNCYISKNFVIREETNESKKNKKNRNLNKKKIKYNNKITNKVAVTGNVKKSSNVKNIVVKGYSTNKKNKNIKKNINKQYTSTNAMVNNFVFNNNLVNKNKDEVIENKIITKHNVDNINKEEFAKQTEEKQRGNVLTKTSTNMFAFNNKDCNTMTFYGATNKINKLYGKDTNNCENKNVVVVNKRLDTKEQEKKENLLNLENNEKQKVEKSNKALNKMIVDVSSGGALNNDTNNKNKTVKKSNKKHGVISSMRIIDITNQTGLIKEFDELGKKREEHKRKKKAEEEPKKKDNEETKKTIEEKTDGAEPLIVYSKIAPKKNNYDDNIIGYGYNGDSLLYNYSDRNIYNNVDNIYKTGNNHDEMYK